eukprot:TRINITY_DN7842_c0_g1_i12.p1 TRINITY_DN7842_c0_g1~~TRINITY_DN7842_c0_g1_i12.p1  ORF type:complete len:704 (-),score=101.72 TRINITY_DN7842_c0_g1_i12:100-2211(-)
MGNSQSARGSRTQRGLDSMKMEEIDFSGETLLKLCNKLNIFVEDIYEINTQREERVSWRDLYNEITQTPKWTDWEGSYQLYHLFYSLLVRKKLLCREEKQLKEFSVVYWLRALGPITNSNLKQIFTTLNKSNGRKKIYTSVAWGSNNVYRFPHNEGLTTLKRLMEKFESTRSCEKEVIKQVMDTIPSWILMQNAFGRGVGVPFLDYAWSLGCWAACELCIERGIPVEPKSVLWGYRNPYSGLYGFISDLIKKQLIPKMDIFFFYASVPPFGRTHNSFPELIDYLLPLCTTIYEEGVRALLASTKFDILEKFTTVVLKNGLTLDGDVDSMFELLPTTPTLHSLMLNHYTTLYKKDHELAIKSLKKFWKRTNNFSLFEINSIDGVILTPDTVSSVLFHRLSNSLSRFAELEPFLPVANINAVEKKTGQTFLHKSLERDHNDISRTILNLGFNRFWIRDKYGCSLLSSCQSEEMWNILYPKCLTESVPTTNTTNTTNTTSGMSMEFVPLKLPDCVKTFEDSLTPVLSCELCTKTDLILRQYDHHIGITHSNSNHQHPLFTNHNVIVWEILASYLNTQDLLNFCQTCHTVLSLEAHLNFWEGHLLSLRDNQICGLCNRTYSLMEENTCDIHWGKTDGYSFFCCGKSVPHRGCLVMKHRPGNNNSTLTDKARVLNILVARKVFNPSYQGWKKDPHTMVLDNVFALYAS